MSDPATEYDAFAAVIRTQTAAIERSIRSFPPEEWVTQERIARAQRIAQRLHEVCKEFAIGTED